MKKSTSPVLNNINLSIGSGEITGIVGASGSGKTTLVQLLNGLLKPQSGDILLDSVPARYEGESLLKWRREVGLVFQFPDLQFFENTVWDEIAFGLHNFSLDDPEIEARVEEVCNEVDLRLNTKVHSPFHASAGEKRRIAIASVLVMMPKILILDEPTSALDFHGIRMVTDLIRKLATEQRGIAIVSHDMDFIADVASRVVVLSGGKIVFDGPKESFFLNEELLDKSHLELPRILKLIKALRGKGLTLDYPLFSIEKLKEIL